MLVLLSLIFLKLGTGFECMKRAHSDDEDNVLPYSMFPSPPLAPWWRPMLCNVGGFWFSGEEKLDGEKTSDTKGRLSTTTLTHAQMGLHTRTQKSWTVGAWSTNVENFRPQSESENLAPPSLCNTIKKTKQNLSGWRKGRSQINGGFCGQCLSTIKHKPLSCSLQRS